MRNKLEKKINKNWTFRKVYDKKWLKENYPHINTPRSACTFCPFRNNEDWITVRENEEEWQKVVEFDKNFDC